MIWTAYLDESGTHDDSPIMLMGGYLGNNHQWDAFNIAWRTLLGSEGIEFCHAKDLQQGKKQFKDWPVKQRQRFGRDAEAIIEKHLQLGVSSIIRRNDYNFVYKGHRNPNKLREDSKYGVLFRGCLMVVEAAATMNNLPRKDLKLNFVLEDGHENAGDALRLFELAKRDHLPEWEHLLGTLQFGKKESCGLQAADLLIYYTNRLEKEDHGRRATDVERSPHILLPGESQSGRVTRYRMPIGRKVWRVCERIFSCHQISGKTCRRGNTTCQLALALDPQIRTF
jgi:hypothetical protein